MEKKINTQTDEEAIACKAVAEWTQKAARLREAQAYTLACARGYWRGGNLSRGREAELSARGLGLEAEIAEKNVALAQRGCPRPGGIVGAGVVSRTTDTMFGRQRAVQKRHPTRRTTRGATAKSIPKVHRGPRGGRYVIRRGRKVYVGSRKGGVR